MARYYLTCPSCEFGLRARGGSEEGPIYQCGGCNRFWALSFSRDRSFKRVLREYDAASGRTVKAIASEVPEDWDGEPSAIGIPPDEWHAVCHPEDSGSASNLAAAIVELIEEGNFLFLSDYDGVTTHRLHMRNGNLQPVAIRQAGT